MRAPWLAATDRARAPSLTVGTMSLINYLTRIHFADDVLEEAVLAETAALGIRRPLVVTDRGVLRAGLLDRLLDAFDSRTEPVVFSETPSNPTEAACRQAAEIFMGNDCDCLIGFGGGSSIDLAKAVGILVTHDGALQSYAAVEGGTARIRDVLPPIIAIPTTAGTGSEVGRGALIILDDGRKLGLLSPYLIPKVAICDPTLTLTLPPLLTAGTGMDALTHCVETYIATAYNPPADGIALDGLRRAAANIERAVQKGSDLQARREMMAAAMNGALAFQKGLGGVHAMSHALGGLAGYQLHHGTLNAVLLPHMLEFNAPAVSHRYTALKDAIDLPRSDDLSEALSRLSCRIGLPKTLAAMGVDRAAIERAAPQAEKDHTNGTNPRRAMATDYLQLMSAAL
ncbi:iron-containing alcohol dehydrogenase [Rhizobium sp. LjRoot30]|uniref:iron-containing alcohol dehydrogenase n=1 Tax=Rhizobium sp. LjRoot30 TaxID=3342320 RepID=UPI003F5007DF